MRLAAVALQLSHHLRAFCRTRRCRDTVGPASRARVSGHGPTAEGPVEQVRTELKSAPGHKATAAEWVLAASGECPLENILAANRPHRSQEGIGGSASPPRSMRLEALAAGEVPYFTANVTPSWLRRAPVDVPIDTVNGIDAPVRAVGGTTALICTSPATEPCDAPA
jgi:hypothetical protein